MRSEYRNYPAATEIENQSRRLPLTAEKNTASKVSALII